MAVRLYEVLVELQALLEGGLSAYHPSVQLVYLALWSRSRVQTELYGLPREQTCSVTQDALATQLGLGRRTVQRALQALQALQLIAEVSSGAGRCPAVYRLFLPQGVRSVMGRHTHEWELTGEGERASYERVGEPWRHRLTSDDRALLEALVDGLSESERDELEHEARRRLAGVMMAPTAEQVADELMRQAMLRHFGPERLRQYWQGEANG